MKAKAGSIIFLTRRKEKPNYRIFLSYMIALFTRKKKQPLNKVKVHSAIIYEHDNVMRVRDMDKDGDDHYTLEKYKKLYGDRLEIVNNHFNFSEKQLIASNFSCRTLKVKYDYKNTFFWQVIKRFSGFFVGKITLYKRMCAEDMQRQFNILIPGFFKTPEATNPNEAYEYVKKKYIL